MSIRDDECLSEILLQLKFQAIILKDYWPLRGPVGSHAAFSSVFARWYSSSLERTIEGIFLSGWRVLARAD